MLLFNSLNFFAFFTLIFSLFWIIPKKFQWLLLLISSYWFYGSWDLSYVLLLIITTLVNFKIALLFEKKLKSKKILLIFALIFNLGLLFVFKYFDFITQNLNNLFSLTNNNFSISKLNLILPVAISFYTFQSISYLVDVYKGKTKAEKHLGYFALFISFFPKLISGPLERAADLIPQFKAKKDFSYSEAVSGLQLFTFGLFKKIVIADNLALVVNRVFENLSIYKGLSLVLTMIFFSWQIYCDFSGYTDMARGLAKMIGISLSQNFHNPYLATSVRNFWRRWHITLSNWLKDYLYIPLGGNHYGIFRTYLNYLIVFSLCGLWHGASWSFVIWGTFLGVTIIIERLITSISKNKIKLPKILAITYTYTIITISWIFFRAETFSDAIYVLKNIGLGLKNFISPSYIAASISQIFITNQLEIILSFGLLFFIIIFDYFKSKTNIPKLFHKLPIILRFTLYITAILAIIHLRDANIAKFIYIRF